MTEHADHSAHGRDGHGHAHAPTDFGKAFAIGIGLNIAFVLIEAIYGVWSNSLALVADAGHNLSDVLGLAVACAAAVLGNRAPTARYTYGMKGSSIMAALFNAVILLVAMGAIAWEAVRRFAEPAPVAGITVMVVAGIGILVNGVTAWLFASGRKGDLNVKGAFLHMAADAAVSAGVVVAGLLITLTGWRWVDPVTSLAIAAMVVWSTWGLLRESVRMSLDAVPSGIDPGAVRAHLRDLDGVTAVHDLHVWPMSTTEVALTSHLVMPAGADDTFLMRAAHELKDRFGIAHVTLQVETSEATACALAPDGVV
ncbi:cation diffusion facilitator family transporter [Methylobacterium ajmalii]|jgi:cobalt-zinc-cadmium efflux system protein|uniref:cation diffusion facilitator family transporter n=1 Tax=Methylobacterium ajmalii TaxID=2738439 RepID=UPI00190C1908|nr:cation diffusion facilitator family transporter [Methylobacterium ajmalii]MBK3396714.1 cation transporter [Methylobacterium ajmalii]MBK3407730.1 cation transporter [Methylobacterium ajmalii]MBK3422218.1 cation transporter [Methylobacterium ajmalii]MBZ6412707.1 cation diffusion facilitator family transporter [Methylobacterium sp.]